MRQLRTDCGDSKLKNGAGFFFWLRTAFFCLKTQTGKKLFGRMGKKLFGREKNFSDGKKTFWPIEEQEKNLFEVCETGKKLQISFFPCWESFFPVQLLSGPVQFFKEKASGWRPVIEVLRNAGSPFPQVLFPQFLFHSSAETELRKWNCGKGTCGKGTCGKGTAERESRKKNCGNWSSRRCCLHAKV